VRCGGVLLAVCRAVAVGIVAGVINQNKIKNYIIIMLAVRGYAKNKKKKFV